MPRQGGVVPKLYGRITLLPKYRVPEAIYGLDGFSHIWLLWDFSESHCDDESGVWSPTVRPPRLGGNKRMGVFATRSPFRPNSIGLSVVKLEKIDFPDIYVSGVDLMDGTPIYDIKPYIPYSDSVPEAKAGFTDSLSELKLKVCFPENLMNELLSVVSNLSQSTTEERNTVLQSTTEQSAEERNTVLQSTTEQSIEERSTGVQSKTNQSIEERSTCVQNMIARSTEERDAGVQGATKQSAEARSTEGRDAGVQGTTEQSATKQSADEQNTRGQAIEKQGAGEQIKSEILDILSHDMRPQYQNDPERVYGITYLHRNIRFKIDGDTLTVLSVD